MKTLLFWFCWAAVLVRAEVALAPVFSDHMVLQRGVALPVWGRAEPHAPVTVEFAGHRAETTADAAGHWLVRLPAQEADAKPRTLRVTSGAVRCAIGDVLVGDVWLCAGQSNMEWPLEREAHAAAVLPQARLHAVRLFSPAYPGKDAGGRSFTSEEVARLGRRDFFRGAWAECTPESARTFSAIGFYFARELAAALELPVGVINVAVGGSPAEAWLPTAVLAGAPELRALAADAWLDNPLLEAWCRQRARENLERAIVAGEVDAQAPDHLFRPGYLWSAVVASLAPMPIKGVLWYQGESNSLRLDRVRQHELILPRLVEAWRAHWGLGDFPFYYCQLSSIDPAHYRSAFWPEFRDSQRRLQAVIPNSGMVVTSDVGDAASVHPREKRTVGLRLARLALVDTYRREMLPGGPVPGSARLVDKTVELEFSDTGDALGTSDGREPLEFELAGADRQFVAVRARLVGRRIQLDATSCPQPRFVRYGWSPFCGGNVVNEAMQPLSSFELAVSHGTGDLNPDAR